MTWSCCPCSSPLPENQSLIILVSGFMYAVSNGFFNFTSRRPRHLLHLLKLGYNVMYNDVDMVWLEETPLHILKPPPGKKGLTYICSCMIFLSPTPGAKLVMKKWIEELQDQPWSEKAKANDQPGWICICVSIRRRIIFQEQDLGGKHAIIHNFEKKIQGFYDFGFRLVDEHSNESPHLVIRIRN
ncbi:hypothetical protein C5167_027235 [Papaver somniferum]|nr:hypothetical protein C5167_027235 [Papaver somniferum]